jgi:uncharacterized membrane protein
VDHRREPTWEPRALIGIAVLGFAIAVYLTATHANAVPLVCSINSVVNCASVTHSTYSVIFGTSIPISILGVGWFLVSGLLSFAGLRAMRSDWPEPAWLRPVHLVWATLALIFVLYLVYIEIVVLHQICEWCSVVHLLIVATFVLTLLRLQRA